MKLPNSLQFLRPGWWLLHAVAVGGVFAAGFFVSHHLAGHAEHGHEAHSGSDAHAKRDGHAKHDAHAKHDGHAKHDKHAGHDAHADHHGGHHDHTSPEVLRPLMKQMLADSVQLQGAIAAKDLARAAVHADAIAGACEDPGSEHGTLPQRLGPAFLKHDRELHGSASHLGDALRAGRLADSRTLNQEMVTACQSCHAQAPSAEHVDLRVLMSFADALGSTGDAP